jgi:hypothetical protein
MDRRSDQESSLPEFWKAAILELRELELKRRQTSLQGAGAQPLWNNAIDDVKPDEKYMKVWKELHTTRVAHLTNDKYQRYTRKENCTALEPYKCDTIEGTIIIQGTRYVTYVTEEVLYSFEDICDAIPQEWLLPPLMEEHIDRPCEGAWWGQLRTLTLLSKTSKTPMNMTEATQALDKVLNGSSNKRKRRPLRGY